MILRFTHLKKFGVLFLFILLYIFAFNCLPRAIASGLPETNIYNISSEKYTIESIDYKLPSGIPLRDIKNFFAIKSGQKFSMYYLEKTLKALYSTGYFSNIMVFSKIDRKQKFMYLKFIFVRRVYIEKIDIRGLKDTGVPEENILKSIPLKKAGQFLKYYKEISIDEIKNIMSDAGYPDAKIDISSYVLRNIKKYVIDINITPNKPVIISNIFVKFKVYYPKEKVAKLVEDITGKPLNKLLIKKLRRKIRGIYKEEGYLNTIIPEPKITYISKYKAIITVEVHPGYKILFHFKGISPLKASFIEDSVFNIKNVLIFDESTFTSFKTVLTDFYKEEGYYYAEVSFREEKDSNNKTINLYYTVNKGFRVAVKSITIKGNEPFSKSVILSLMKTAPASFFSRQYFRRKRLADDITNIENYYNNEGYFAAAISQHLTFSRDKKSVAILVDIKKGTRTYVKKVSLAGLPPEVKTKDLTGYFEGMQNKPFYIIKAENGKNLLSTKLADSGYVFSKTRLDIEYSADKKYADLYYDVNSGPLTRIKNILIFGNTITKTAYIKGLLLFKKGEIYDQKNIIETQNRLYRAGIFNYVSIGIENPQNIEPDKNIIVKVRDAKPISLSFGAGYGTYTRYKGFVQIDDSNLFGSGKSLSARFSKSAVYTNLLLDYYDPAIYNYRGLAFNARGLDNDIITLNYTLHKEGGVFSLIRRFNSHLEGLLSYEMFYNFLSGLNPGAQITPRDIGFTRISAVAASIIYNTKNNIFNPTSGNLTTLRFSYSSTLFDSQINFIKLFFHTEQFIPFIYNTVLLYSLRFGYIKPLPPTTQVPINERFFLGGRTTVRGFPQDSIGLVNLNPYQYPIGGDIMENYNLQLNIPVYNNFDFFVFQDGGNVFLNALNIRPLALYKSAGAGIMYLSPIGPISFSYGFILNRRPYWPAGGVNFTIGTSF